MSLVIRCYERIYSLSDEEDVDDALGKVVVMLT